MLRILAYLLVITSLLGAKILSIDLGFMQLSPFRILIIITVVLFIIKKFKDKQKISIIGKKDNKFSVIVMIVWLVYAAISYVWVKDYVGWFKDVYFIGLGVICIILFDNIIESSEQIFKCIRCFAVIAILHNLMGWYEVISGNYIFLNSNSLGLYRFVKYPVSVFGNTNDFATFIIFAIFVLYICLANSERILEKILCMTFIISSLVLLYFTSSRANMLGLVLVVLFLIYLFYKKKGLLYTAFAIMSVICIIAIIKPEYFLLLKEKIIFYMHDASGSSRINLFLNSFVFLNKTYWTGVGAGNVEYWMSHYSLFDTYHITSMHNWWMEILTSYGIAIFLLYLAFYIKLFFNLMRKYKYADNKLDKSLSLGFMCCMVAYIFGGISASSNIDTEWLWVFWAVVIAYQGLSFNKTKTNTTE